MSYLIGIDLGGSSVKAAALDSEANVLLEKTIAFDLSGNLDWAQKIKELIDRVEQEHGEPALTIGLSAPGLADRAGRAIAYMPGRLQGLEGLNWTHFLKRKNPVCVLNDAHAALLGEAWKGAARGFANVIMLTLGTGVGGAAIVNNRLLLGETGRAGHFGHATVDGDKPVDTCGMPGSLEMAIGNCSIRMRSKGKFSDTHELLKASLAGDDSAAKVWTKSVQDLARGVASFINIFDPGAVIIGGGIAKAGSTLFDPLKVFLDNYEWRPGGHAVRILPAQLGGYAGAYGAAHHAWETCYPDQRKRTL